MSNFIILIILLLVKFLCLPNLALAYTLIGGPNESKLPVHPDAPEAIFYWDGSSLDPKDKDTFEGGANSHLEEKEYFRHLLIKAMDLWNNTKGSYLRLVLEEDESVDIDSEDEINVISVLSLDSKTSGAAAQPNFSDDGKTIKDCDISIGKGKSDARYVASAIAHELGHCLGLGHNHTNTKSLMGYTRTQDDLWLSGDDKAGLIYLYPDPKYDTSEKDFLACAVVGKGEKTATVQLWLVLILLMPLAFAATFRSRVIYLGTN